MTVTQPSPSPASWCPELRLVEASAVNTERHRGIYVVSRPTQHHPRAYPAYVTSWGYVIPVWGFVVAPSSKLISTWGGSGGHILACDTLICLLDMRSKNMSTSWRTLQNTKYAQLFADQLSILQLQILPTLIGPDERNGEADPIH